MKQGPHHVTTSCDENAVWVHTKKKTKVVQHKHSKKRKIKKQTRTCAHTQTHTLH